MTIQINDRIFDLDQKGPQGRTNIERMKQGLSPESKRRETS